MNSRFYFVVVVGSCTGKQALAVDVDYGIDLMEAFS